MAYVLRAVIAPGRALQQRGHGVVVDLEQGFALMPMTSAQQADEPYGEFLPRGFEATLAEWSAEDPIAYVEAEYWAGTGLQYATVWHRGEVVFGPLFKDEDEPLPAEGSPISQALRRLGVSALGHYDEFDAAGLGRHRGTEDWITAGGASTPSP
ncbi:hypothetical protein [Paractinoplanes lichenicola]|uniref:Uncharacterized protein n=1 Tax=Paractinoplanes lichenicola TaxID=2802976 RepID=A0ABS1VWT5_9ACTN|nr:hypothetical protein [Actinoplanes lichenicola]MBL7258952.1 hypothetical protein [Actinoplanes lichenicola]